MKICILKIGTRSDVQPYIALGLGLKTAGHEVTIATLEEFQSLITCYALRYFPLRGDFLKAAQTIESTTGGSSDPLRLIRQYIEMAKVTLEDEWVSAREAELFIYNPAAIGAYHIAEKLGVPTFAAFPTPLYSPTREFPSPFFPFSTLGPFNKLSHKVFAKISPATYRRPINLWRKDVLGLPPARSQGMLNGRPITRLYAYSEVTVPRPADWDESSVVTGYWFLDAPSNWQPEPALVNFINDGPVPVYVGFVSMSMFGGREAYRSAGLKRYLQDRFRTT